MPTEHMDKSRSIHTEDLLYPLPIFRNGRTLQNYSEFHAQNT